MTLKRLLFPVAIAWMILNVVGLGLAVGDGEGAHAMVHAVLIAAFGGWAWYLRRKPAVVTPAPDVAALQAELDALQRQLQEKQEGLDFAEQLLAQRMKQPDSRVLRRELDDRPDDN